MKNKNSAVGEHDDGSYVVKKTKKSSIFAFIVCVLVAFVIWAYAEATESSKNEKETASDTSVACVTDIGAEYVI